MMNELPDDAVAAAARAIFDHSIIAGSEPGTDARHWLSQADHYRDIARAALMAALPYLRAAEAPDMRRQGGVRS